MEGLVSGTISIYMYFIELYNFDHKGIFFLNAMWQQMMDLSWIT